MDESNQEILEEFVIESKEGLESIEDDFLTLEKTKDAPDLNLVNKIFRAIHSIKGASGFLGLQKISKLSHIMENLISKIRDQTILPESLYVDALLEGVDLLNVMLDDIKNTEQVDTDSALKKLHELLASVDPNSQNQPTEASLPTDKSEEQPGDPTPEMDDLQKAVLAELMGDLGQESDENKKEDAVTKAPDQSNTAPPPTKAKEKKEKSDTKKTETIRINVELLDKLMRMAGELVLVRNQQLQHVDRSDAISRSISQKLDVVTTELQESIMKTRMQPIGNIFGKFPRVIREMSKMLGKKLEVNSTGNDVELDKTILESLADPLTHLIRNSCDHGVEMPEDRIKVGKPEESTIFLHAYHEGGLINIKIVDDGKGINLDAVKNKVIEKGLKTEQEISEMTQKELANLITLPGLSTAQKVTDISGRGVGMDVVRTSIEKLGGSMEIETEEGKGTTILLKLPLTLAIIPSLLIRVDNERFAIPQISLEELVCLYDEDIYNKFEIADKQTVYRLRGQLLPVIQLKDILSQNKSFSEEDKANYIHRYQESKNEPCKGKSLTFAVLKLGNNRFGLIMDEVLGSEEIVVKPMHPSLKQLSCYSGSTVLGDGKVALILDIEGISRFAGVSYHQTRSDSKNNQQKQCENTQSVLLFKSGAEEQLAVPLDQIKRIQPILPEKFEKAGQHTFINVDDTPTRIVKINDFIPLSACQESKEMFLILPKDQHPFGLLISSLVNIQNVTNDLNTESFQSKGLLGSALVNDQMTLFVDINKVGKMALESV